MKYTLFLLILLVASFVATLQAQDNITNAFDDLQRKGNVSEQDSEMRQAASTQALEKLLQEKPITGYFCFTEDRMYDIRMTDAIPARWLERSVESRN